SNVGSTCTASGIVFCQARRADFSAPGMRKAFALKYSPKLFRRGNPLWHVRQENPYVRAKKGVACAENARHSHNPILIARRIRLIMLSLLFKGKNRGHAQIMIGRF